METWLLNYGDLVLIYGDVVAYLWRCVCIFMEMHLLIYGDLVAYLWRCGNSFKETWWLILEMWYLIEETSSKPSL